MSKPDRTSLEAGYETGDMQPRKVLMTAALVIAALVMVAGAARLLSVWYGQTTAGASRGTLPVSVPAPEPHLRPKPENELRQHLEEKRQRLTGYGWVDRESGVAHIPIDQAMELRLQRLQTKESWP